MRLELIDGEGVVKVIGYGLFTDWNLKHGQQDRPLLLRIEPAKLASNNPLSLLGLVGFSHLTRPAGTIGALTSSRCKTQSTGHCSSASLGRGVVMTREVMMVASITVDIPVAPRMGAALPFSVPHLSHFTCSTSACDSSDEVRRC